MFRSIQSSYLRIKNTFHSERRIYVGLFFIRFWIIRIFTTNDFPWNKEKSNQFYCFSQRFHFADCRTTSTFYLFPFNIINLIWSLPSLLLLLVCFFFAFPCVWHLFCSLVECWHGPKRTKNHAESNKKRKIYIIIIFYDARLLAVCFLFVVCWFSQCDLRNSLY